MIMRTTTRDLLIDSGGLAFVNSSEGLDFRCDSIILFLVLFRGAIEIVFLDFFFLFLRGRCHGAASVRACVRVRQLSEPERIISPPLDTLLTNEVPSSHY